MGYYPYIHSLLLLAVCVYKTPLQTEVNQLCRGTLVMHHMFKDFVPFKGPIENARKVCHFTYIYLNY